MAGNSEGAKKAHKTTIQRHGAKFVEDRARKGGESSNTGGFAGDPDRAAAAAKKSHINRRRADTGGKA